MSRKTFFVIILSVLVLASASARESETEVDYSFYKWGFIDPDGIHVVETSPYSIDAEYLARSGSGIAIADSSLAFETNPAALISPETGFSVPYISFAVRSPKDFADLLSDSDNWLNHVDPVEGALYQMTSGFNYRMQGFGVDFHVTDNVYSHTPVENSTTNMYFMNELMVKSGAGMACEMDVGRYSTLSLGAYVGLQYSLYSSSICGERIDECIKKEDFPRIITDDLSYAGVLAVSLTAGAILTADNGFSAAAVVRNPSLYFNYKEFDNGNDASNYIFDGQYYADALSSMSYMEDWDGDIGIAWKNRISSSENFSVSADLVNVRELCENNTNNWLNHFKAGLEYRYENITLRGGWQISGPSVGIGLEFPIVTVDAAYRFDQLAVTLRFGKN